ncbi:MAG: allophanate hydrolase [Chthoniobacterales bacterium]
MTSIEKLSLDLLLIRSVYRTGDFTPTEVIQEVYRRIRASSGSSVWLWLREEADCLAYAEKVAERLDLPLAGVPFAVTDNIDAMGIPTTAGCQAFAYIPKESATVVRLIEAAGGILIGKTVVDQFAVGLAGVDTAGGHYHSVYGNNCIAGGPGTGAALAVASGFASFAIGTDTTGAGQSPAAYNHLVSIKPTQGIVSTKGFVPGCRSLDCASIFASCVSDAASVLDVIVAEDPEDPWSRAARAHTRFACPFVFGVPKVEQREFNADLESEICYLRAIEHLEALGGRAVEIDFAPFRESSVLAESGAWAAERFHAVGGFVEAHTDAVEPAVARSILSGKLINAADVFQATYQREILKKMTTGVWEKIDLLVMPTAPTKLSPADARQRPDAVRASLSSCSGFVNLLDLASISVPMGFRTDGIPFGLSLIAPAFSDWELCRIAKTVTGETLSIKTPKKPSHADASDILLVVTGTHMMGGSMNHELLSRRATFRESVETAPDYALYALEGEPPRPGLINVGSMIPNSEVKKASFCAEGCG